MLASDPSVMLPLVEMMLSLPAPEMARALPGLARGELLCQAYQAYRGLVPDGMISFEHAVFLLTTLVLGDELTLGGCRDCGATLLVDRWSLRAPRCPLCAADHAQGTRPLPAVTANATTGVRGP